MIESRMSLEDLDFVCCDCGDFITNEEIQIDCNECPITLLKFKIKKED